MNAVTSRIATILCAIRRIDFQPQSNLTEAVFTLHCLGADEEEVADLISGDGQYQHWIAVLDELMQRGFKHLNLTFVGPNIHTSQHGQSALVERGVVPIGITVSSFSCLYHEFWGSDSDGTECAPHRVLPDLLILFNAGLWGYQSWVPTLELLFSNTVFSNSQVTVKSFPRIVVTSYTFEESEDDYDTMFENFQRLQQLLPPEERCLNLRWHWDCELNPHASTVSLVRATNPEGRPYYENAAWQCVSLVHDDQT